MSNAELKRLVLKCFLEQQFAMLTALGPVAYMITLTIGLPPDLAWHVTWVNFGTLTPIFGVILPLTVIWLELKNALTSRPGDAPGDQLKRILKAPRRIEGIAWMGYGVSCILWAGWPTLLYGLDPWDVPLTVASFLLLAAVVGIRMALRLERLLRPYALEEFHKYPQVRVEDRGYAWPKQRWYLPYCFALFVLATLTVTGIIVYKKTQTGFGELFASLAKLVPDAVMMQLRTEVASILGTVVVPVVSVGGFLIFAAAWCAWELARHQSTGTDAVQKSIESIASGRPSLPNWVATDEVGDLSSSTAGAFERLRTFASSLSDSAQMLGKSAEALNSSHKEQTEALSSQAASLQETQVTAQEIKQTSIVAAQKAEDVLTQAERADQIGRAGEAALEQSVEGMHDIQKQVLQMAQSIRALDDQARQIANITTTVKSLADRSTMLALNAAIEAVRSGEHGKGFAVVAREIRSLADQSIKATYSVQGILQNLSEAIRSTAEMSERGSERVQGSVQQLQSFGDNIRQLSGIVRDNVSSVRQISAAVTQQNQGIGQIFQAVNDLTKIMDQTMSSLRTSDEAADQMRMVAERVSIFVGEYDWQSRKQQRAVSHLPPPPGTGGGEASSEEKAT
ncbi:methyl-accepting chemotaxis protein [Archangium sp.]|uniref:methyl-accepting chemotaxis protein n=1 Tax=Archangium sp. TaxID=1872627 RepID=UPI002D23C951|nr:methyl-accepting chemotaxis protein [Archangium sp.]HYO51422.1 methyl-accepting chemotaxis protein [Archangium sp.]